MEKRKNSIVDEFLVNTDPKFKEIAERLNEIILSTDRNLEPSIKWRQLTFALNSDFHHWVCAINVTKNSVTLNFHFGGLLKDENNILKSGTSKFLRKIEFKKIQEVNEDIIQGFIHQALEKLQYFKENWKELNKKD